MAMPQYWVQSQHYFDILERDTFPAWTQYWIADADMPPAFDFFSLCDAFNFWFWTMNAGHLVWTTPFSVPTIQIWAMTSSGIRNDNQVSTFAWALGDPMPQSQCGVLRRWTAGTGRSSRGRGYISQLPKAAVVGNSLDETFRSGLELQWNTLLAPINVDGVNFTQALPSYTNVTLTPITHFTLMPRLGVLHRRARPAYRPSIAAGPRRYPM